LAERGGDLGLSADEMAFYVALETNQTAVRELGDATLRKIAAEFTDQLRKNISVNWSVRETVRAKLRLLVKRIVRKYKYCALPERLALV
jgi:type I restriction enzyme, R subunit